MADKTKTIKNASDQELDALILRLRKENDAQQLVRNLKSGSNPPSNYMNPVDLSVSTETPIEDLYHEEIDEVLAHFGIPGMKWGQRKYRHAFIQDARKKSIEDSRKNHETIRTANNKARKAMKDAGKKFDANEKQKKLDAQSTDYKTSRELKAKSYKTLSNKELKALNERMQLERNMRDLKSSDYQKGLDVVKTLTAAGTTVASLYALSTTPLGQAVKKAITHK